MRLAQNANRLKPIAVASDGMLDKHSVDLYGALRYAQSALSDHPDPNVAGIGKQLGAYADRLHEARDISPEARAEISEYLREHKVTRLMADPETYLVPKVEPPVAATPPAVDTTAPGTAAPEAPAA
jgi:hypothetical protein